jgi:hypothetical protein
MDHSMRVRGRKGSTFHSHFYGLKTFGCKTVSSWLKLGPRQCLGFPDKFPMQPLRVAFEDARMNRIENVIIEIGELGFSLGDRNRQRLLQVGSDISWIHPVQTRPLVRAHKKLATKVTKIKAHGTNEDAKFEGIAKVRTRRAPPHR